MTTEILTLRSSIKSGLARSALVRGTILAGVGVLLLLWGGTWMSQEALSHFGTFIFLGGVLLIGFGMRPYRKLTKLELQPYEVRLGEHALLFVKSGQPLFDLPLALLDKVDYFEREQLYGISVSLKKTCEERIAVKDPHFDMGGYLQKCQRRYGSDLFFPYFTKRSYQKLCEHMLSS